MGKLDGMWSRIGSVTMNEVIVAVLEDEIEIHKSRLQDPNWGLGHIHVIVGGIEKRIEELKK